MPTQVDDIYEVRIVCSTEDQVGINRRYWKVVSVGGNGLTPTELAGGFDSLFAPLYKALLSDQATYEGCSAQRVDPLPKEVAGIGVGQKGPGINTGDMLPTQTAGLISFRTPFAGRQFRGRAYIPFPPESANEADALPGVGYLNSLGALGDEFIQDQIFQGGADSATMRHVLWNETTRQDYIIEGFTGQNRWATQRRRGSYGQQNVAPF